MHRFSGLYTMVSRHGAGDGWRVVTTIDLCMTASANGGHYELMDIAPKSSVEHPDPSIHSDEGDAASNCFGS